MQADNDDQLFRSADQLSKEASRTNKANRHKRTGDPIDLGGKVLRAVVRNGEVWCATSGGSVKRVGLETGSVTQSIPAHRGPCTSLAFVSAPISPSSLLITASWDKTIRVHRITSSPTFAPIRPATTADAHADFIKTLLPLPTLGLLVSGSSDKTLKFWDLRGDLVQPLGCLETVREHTRPVEALEARVESDGRVRLWSADSMGMIRVWTVQRVEGEERVSVKEEGVVEGHKTAVYDLKIGRPLPDDDEEPLAPEELWSSSSDNSALRHLLTPSPSPALALPHPYYVKTVLPLSHHVAGLDKPYVLTGSTDENIRVWAPHAVTPGAWTCVRVVEGHFNEVNSLGVWDRRAKGEGVWIVSAGLDGTVRRWKFEDILKPPPEPVEEEEEEKDGMGMTEEEERELAELMDD